MTYKMFQMVSKIAHDTVTHNTRTIWWQNLCFAIK